MLVCRHPAFATGHERYLRNTEDNPYSVGEINKQAGIQATICFISGDKALFRRWI